MKLIKTKTGNTMTMEIEGWLDTESSPQLHEEIEKLPEEVTNLVLDCTKMDYISSAGLRVLLFAHKTMAKKEGLCVKGANEDVKSVLKMSGFYNKLNIQ